MQDEKIIFLSLNGVLISKDFSRVNKILKNHVDTNLSIEDNFGELFDERCVKWLRYIIHQTKAKLVLMPPNDKLTVARAQEMWESRELPGEVVDVIHDNDPWLWRSIHKHELKFIILDSELTPSPVVIQPHNEIGLAVKDIHQIIVTLNG